MKVQRAVVVTLTLVRVGGGGGGGGSHCKISHLSFLCDGKGAVRKAILYISRSCYDSVLEINP